MDTTYFLRHNTAEHRYEFDLGTAVAYIAYEEEGDTLRLTHTLVPKGFEGRGIAGELTRQTLEAIRAEHRRIIAECSYIDTWIRRHPEWEEIRTKE